MRATPYPQSLEVNLEPAVRPDAAAYESLVPDAETAVLLCHGFTGSPRSMRPWAEYLEAAGFSVSVPLLPGHGTSWQDANHHTWQEWFASIQEAYQRLREKHDRVYVAGLSMGGALALRLAQTHADVAGIILVNPAVASYDQRLKALGVLQHFSGSIGGIGNDIAKRTEDPSIDEYGYDRTPLKAAHSMYTGLWPRVRADLGRVSQPILYFRSRTDHCVDGASLPIIIEGVASRDVTVRILARSWHVATLDYEAEKIFTESVEWIRTH